MAEIIVNSLLDDGDGDRTTLREAIAEANANAGADTITFDLDAGALIRLNGSEIEITGELVIDGGGEVIITADSDANDILVGGSAITDVARTEDDTGDLYSDNSRIFHITDSNATTTLKGLTLTGGRIEGGPLLARGGAVRSNAELVLENVTMSGNSAAGGGGGGVYAFQAITLTDSIVSGNSAAVSGGGIYSFDAVHLTNSSVSGNTVGDSGGGINGSFVTLTNSTVSGNSARNGGGIRGDSVTLSNSTVSGNSSNVGGGILGGFQINLYSSTISGNTAETIGGGIFIESSSGFPLKIINSIVLGNNAPSERNIFSSRSFSSDSTSSLYQDENPDDVFAETEEIAPGVFAGVLADNGGPTQTIQIKSGGLAHNTGADTDLTTDQRGERRVVGSAVDIGAVELNRAPVVLDDNAETDSDTMAGGLLLTNDSDEDGDTLKILAVNGEETAVGKTVTLASGALLMVNEDGEFSYDPNGAFDDLLRGMTGTDSFEYTTTDSEFEVSAMATITIEGQAEEKTGSGGGDSDNDSGRSATGSPGPDKLFGTGGSDTISGLKGNDTIRGGAGNDDLKGGKGADHLSGGKGNDLLQGGKGKDVLAGGKGNDTIKGGAGQDKGFGGSGSDELRGGNGNDILKGGNNNDKINGGNGNDLIMGGKGNDRLFGGNGNDVLKGGSGNDILRGGSGNDSHFGDSGNDRFWFDQGRDTFRGGTGHDELILDGRLKDYKVAFKGGEAHFRDGKDLAIAINIEEVTFDNRSYDMDDLRALF